MNLPRVAVETPTRLPERNLDVLRAIAVSFVLANHLGILFHPSNVSRSIFNAIGDTGVLFFFVHTSLVLMASLERQDRDAGWVGVFYLRRALRIYPLAIATIVLLLVARVPETMPSIGQHAVASARSMATVISNLLLAQNLVGQPDLLGPFWSLPIEVDMYLLLPLCFLIARRRSALPMVALLAALVAMHALVTAESFPGAWRLTVFHYGPCFFGGVLAYRLLRTRARAALPSWCLLVAIAVAASVELFARSTMENHPVSWIPCLLLGVALPYIGELAPSVVTRVAKTIAKYSYGIYLLHVPVLWFAFDVCRALPLGAQLLVAIVSLVAITWTAYRGVEAPAIELGRRLTHRRLTLAATQPAP